MTKELDERGTLGGFQNYQMRDTFKRFRYEIVNDIGGESGGRTREVDDGEAEIGVHIVGRYVYAWPVCIHLFPEVC